MKLYSMATASHKQLEQEWFLPSLKETFDLQMIACDQQGGDWFSPQFPTVVRTKAYIIRDAVASNQGEIIVWADVDAQFFAPVQAQICTAINGKDMVFQRNDRHNLVNGVCTGFFACRCSAKTLAFWTAVARWKVPFGRYEDQLMVNFLLGNWKFIKGLNPYRIVWDYLPDIFFTSGLTQAAIWHPGESLSIPPGIVMHHANWTVGIENKIAQLTYVRERMTAITS